MDVRITVVMYITTKIYQLHVLQLPTLRYRQLRGDMIQLYKYVNNKYNTNFVVTVAV